MKARSLRANVDRVCRFRRITGGGMRCAVEVTHRCNLACPHCFVERDGQQPALEALLRILRQLPDIGCKKAIITGGEPLVRADLEQIVEVCAALGIMVDLNSNLVSLSPARARALLQAGLAEVSTSLYGDPSAHDRFVNREGAFERTLDGIKTLRRLGVPVDVHCALWDGPGGGLERIVEYVVRLCESLDCGSVTFFTLLPGAQGAQGGWRMEDGGWRGAQVLAGIRDVASRALIPVRTIGLVDDRSVDSCSIDGSAGDAGCAMASGIVGLSASLELKPCLLARPTRTPTGNATLQRGPASPPACPELAVALDDLRRQVALGEWVPLCYQDQVECSVS